MAYEVHLDVFDGPFELLLSLISAQEVDVYEVRLSDIVDAFCRELERMEKLNLELATEFLLIAATLVELKCRRLLPGADDPDLDEEFSLLEARDYLLGRLVECKTYSAAGAALEELERAASRSHARRCGPDEGFADLAPDLLAEVSAQDVCEAARRGLEPRPQPTVAVAHIHSDEVSVMEMFAALIAELPALKEATFRELTATAPTKMHVVASFLAILELYKRDLVDLEQAECFGDLRVRWRFENAPDDPNDLDDYGELHAERVG